MNAPAAPSAATERLAGPAGVARAATLLATGECVAFPTETVYGLGADAGNAQAVAGIFAAKDRPRFNPLICHTTTAEAALALGDFGAMGRKLAAAFWPGPLTLVATRAADAPVAALASAGGATIAVRVPGQPLARDLLARLDRPVAAPSANRSGKLSPTRTDDVLAQLDGRIAAVLDGGPCPVGVESTVVHVGAERATILRPGGITRDALATVLGADKVVASADQGDTPAASPGQLASHYAPAAALRLDASDGPGPGEAWLGFGPAPAGAAERAVAAQSLSPAGDLIEAAANLYPCLHALDLSGAQRIAVAPVPATGLGEAINDRLRRAAAPRPN